MLQRVRAESVRSPLCLCLLLLAGCAEQASVKHDSSSATASSSDAAAPAGEGRVKVIGFSALTLTNPFFKVIADHMTEEAAKHGYEVVVVSGDQDVRKQSDQVDDFIVKGVSAIVLNPCDSRSIGQAIKKANDAGIPVFTNDIKYDGDEGKVVSHVATDNLQGGRLAGEAMVKLLGESGGEVLIVDYPDVESCQLRTRGFREVVDAHNAAAGDAKITIVGALNGKGARDAGYSVTKDAIVAHPNLAAIFAINDPSALGARSALEEGGKQDQVTIIGFDGARAGKEAILEGKILCDPIQFPDVMGRRTVELIQQYFAGDDVPPEVLIPSKLYYKADAEQDPDLQ